MPARRSSGSRCFINQQGNGRLLPALKALNQAPGREIGGRASGEGPSELRRSGGEPAVGDLSKELFPEAGLASANALRQGTLRARATEKQAGRQDGREEGGVRRPFGGRAGLRGSVWALSSQPREGEEGRWHQSSPEAEGVWRRPAVSLRPPGGRQLRGRGCPGSGQEAEPFPEAPAPPAGTLMPLTGTRSGAHPCCEAGVGEEAPSEDNGPSPS